MRIGVKEFKERIKKRLSYLNNKEVDFYFKSLIELLIERFLNNQSVIIDNFGVLARKKTKPRKVINITTGKEQIIVSNTISFRPNYYFIQFFKDKKNRAKLRQEIMKKSEEAYNEMKKKLI
jgi:nucleoid DNA-binding protein